MAKAWSYSPPPSLTRNNGFSDLAFRPIGPAINTEHNRNWAGEREVVDSGGC
jgi:hypothetical protein